MYRDPYWNDTVLDAITDLRSIADQSGLPTAEIALRWAIGRPAVNAVLIGGSRPQNIRANITAIANGPLPVDLADAVSAITARVRGPMPPYNR